MIVDISAVLTKHLQGERADWFGYSETPYPTHWHANHACLLLFSFCLKSSSLSLTMLLHCFRNKIKSCGLLKLLSNKQFLYNLCLYLMKNQWMETAYFNLNKKMAWPKLNDISMQKWKTSVFLIFRCTPSLCLLIEITSQCK